MDPEHPPDSVIHINWSGAEEDLTSLTAGPVGPHAANVPLPMQTAPSVVRKGNRPLVFQGTQHSAATSLDTVHVTVATSRTIRQCRHDQHQQLNVIHGAIPSAARGIKATPRRVDSLCVVKPSDSTLPESDKAHHKDVTVAHVERPGSGNEGCPAIPPTQPEASSRLALPTAGQAVVMQQIAPPQSVGLDCIVVPVRVKSSAPRSAPTQQTNVRGGPASGTTRERDAACHETVISPPKSSGEADQRLKGDETMESVPRAATMATQSDLTGSDNVTRPRKCSACGHLVCADGPSAAEMSATSVQSHVFQCHVCGQRTVRDAGPVMERDDPERYRCRVCHREFDKQDNCKSHEDDAHPDPVTFSCSYCSGIFRLKGERDLHETCTHAKGTIYRCKLCFKKFGSKKRWIKHTAKCRKRRKDLQTVGDHIAVGSVDNELDDNEMAQEEAASDIMATSGGEALEVISNLITTEQGEKLWICGQCGKEFKHQRYFRKHVKDVCGVTAYKCDGCGEEFPTKRKLSAHEYQLKDASHYQCFCGREYQAKQSYRAHKRSHEEDKPYKCRFCEKGFLAINKCKIHERSHTGEKPFSCKVCGKEYVMKESLTVHERKHKKDFRFFCKYCEKGFVKKYTHRMHELNHEGYRPFTCKFCDKDFFRKSDRSRHELCSHDHGKDAYRFLCSHCGRGFKLKGDLKVHERIHTGEKPHFCAYCKRGFGRASYYNRHMRLYHKKQKLAVDSVMAVSEATVITPMETLMTVATCEESS